MTKLIVNCTTLKVTLTAKRAEAREFIKLNEVK